MYRNLSTSLQASLFLASLTVTAPGSNHLPKSSKALPTATSTPLAPRIDVVLLLMAKVRL
jgi:hypothetical protein